MTTKGKTKFKGKKRINITAEPALVEAMQAIARRDGVNVTKKAHDFLWQMVEIDEDIAWAALADSRLKSNKGKWLTHEEVWRGFK